MEGQRKGCPWAVLGISTDKPSAIRLGGCLSRLDPTGEAGIHFPGSPRKEWPVHPQQGRGQRGSASQTVFPS